MDSYEKAERQRQARHRLHAQKARAGRLRNRVIATSLVCFALLWGTVFVQMATGNDPVLGSSSTTKSASAAKARPAEAMVETEAKTEAEPVEAELEVEAELQAEIAQAEAEAAEAEAIELQAAEEELEPVTTSQS
jgi:hypothetical protein